MSFVNDGATPCAFWITERGDQVVLGADEVANLPVDGRMELSCLPIKDCHDVLVDCRNGKGTMIWDARRAKHDTIERAFSLVNRTMVSQEIRFHTLIDAWLTTDFKSKKEASQQLSWFDSFKNILLLPHTKVSEKKISDIQMESAFLSSAFSAWREAARGGDPDLLLSIVNHALMYELTEKGGPLDLVYPGRLHPICQIYGSEWQRRRMTMTQLQKTTDRRYEERVTGVYDDVIECNQPRYDHIHAFVRVQNGLPHWARYRRLLLPWPAVGKARAIYCLAEPTNRIDIPFLDAA